MKVKEIHLRIVGIPILATIMSFVYGTEPGQAYIDKWLTSFLFCAFFWNGACYLFFYFRRRFPYIRQTPKRLIYTTTSLWVFLVMGDAIICVLLNKDGINQLSDYEIIHAMPSMLAGTIIGLAYEAVYFFEQWKHTVKVNESLKNQQIRTQFEVLQNQMSPHFLFNSLNALTALIAEDQNVAIEFTQKLSEVYRYILQNKEKELVSLEKEIEFTKAYLYLLQMRYPENLKAEFRVGEEHMEKYVAPLTLQILVENAVKHNVVSRAQPLTVEIYVENENVINVKNNLQVKNVIEKSTKTGLENIKKRYKFFGSREVKIITTAKNFVVSVPLIAVVHKEDRVLA